VSQGYTSEDAKETAQEHGIQMQVKCLLGCAGLRYCGVERTFA
jgi:hypothetical protein